MNVIEIKNLTKYYGGSLGINDVNLEVKEGEIFGFIGPNGAGKSTTIRLLLGLIYPTSGEAKLFGKDAIEFGPEVRKDIGYLPSEIFYYDKMKVIDLLNYSASFYDKDCTKRIKEISNIMELDLNRRIDDLSYGNKKKVGIVQGLLHEPKLIILDEPTGGLDPLMQQKFFNLLKEENERGATIFFSSHILSEVQELCNRVAIIKEGSIVEVEDIQTLRENNYKKIAVVGDDLSKETFELDGVTELIQEEDELTFFYKGDINLITKALSSIDAKDITIEEPTLEEIFMHYYE
ncbi:ABC-2 type transport system ATP-binding protein [Halolactibacillus halophilus]|uniref:ABC transporter ATP-binding protein n=1 Tax=Halolactibacillus halophilus TaxID=306540 RepID=A0A1I5T5A3_9BACI|nr:ABC transporter ATP-binding protein [Halolactibacillus halophilus]GEM02928.1 ABC transporter ATP-binding protein [Halolactibacillus halophilus]SFP78234.1 ABC-2 type transport system ATP-binding protein [Halolactibacillus halophilus]